MANSRNKIAIVRATIIDSYTKNGVAVIRFSSNPITPAKFATDELATAEMLRLAQMARVRGKDTGPELTVRRLIHALGYRFRLHRRELPGSPDLVFPGRRKVIFVHGCFWHRHPDPGCKLARMPKSRQEFWGPKLGGNRARDERNEAALRAMGWGVLVVWECQPRDRTSLQNTIRTFLES